MVLYKLLDILLDMELLKDLGKCITIFIKTIYSHYVFVNEGIHQCTSVSTVYVMKILKIMKVNEIY